MNKSVLIIDTPKSCKECIFTSLSPNIEEINCCGLMVYLKEEIFCTDGFIEQKPIWCPLLPLPGRKNLRQYTDAALNIDSILAYQHVQGYNDCLYDIQKGSE